MKLYYRIWVDAIVKLRSRTQNAGMWKYLAMTLMSIAMAINFIFLMAILQRNILKMNFYNLEVNFLPGSILNSFFSFFCLFLLPVLLLNYFLIFYKNRYEKLIVRYHYRNGKLFLTYFLLSLFVPLVVLYAGILINRM